MRQRLNAREQQSELTTSQSAARAKIKEFDKIHGQISKLIESNPEVFEQFFELAEEFNVQLQDVKTSLREVKTRDSFSMGSFSRGRVTNTVTYLAGKLPPEVLAIPGVVKSIDPKVIDKLVANGELTEDEAEFARNVKDRSPNVYGPKEIVVKL